MKNTDRHFLSCDWGTSSFRLKVIETDTGRVAAEMTGSGGIKKIHDRWSEYDGPLNRIDFYLSFLKEKIAALAEQSTNDINELPIIISGMASSSIGIRELSYRRLPISLDDPDLNVEIIETTDLFPHHLYLISGICSSDDIMRGEETQLLGLSSKLAVTNGCCLLVGTHSKHVFIKDNVITTFKTYMTGELFDLISSQSILSNSIVTPDDATPGHNFGKGINISQKENLLHSLFKIRARDILQNADNAEYFDLLSGLLIGHELKDLCVTNPEPIILWGSDKLQKYYATALDLLGLDYIQPDFDPHEDITSLGHQIILKQLNN